MAQSSISWRVTPSRFGSLILVVFLGVVLASLAFWGGVAHPGPLFAVGITLLLVLLAVFSALVWWLYFSPLPRTGVVVHQRSAHFTQRLVFLISGSILLLLTGSFWDETWHRIYGTGAAINDLLWPPHLMIYASMAITSMLAISALAVVLRAQGSIRERFRAEPILGWLGIAATYATASAPCDYIWHRIYGVDISAWSLPHLFLVTSTGMVLLLTMTLQLGQIPPHPWARLRGISWQEVLSLIFIGLALVLVATITLSEWDGLKTIGQMGPRNQPLTAFWSRPEWLYGPVLIATALFFQVLALHAIKRVGAATLVTGVVLAERLIFFLAFGVWQQGLPMTFATQLLFIPSAIALDLWYGTRYRQASTNLTILVGNVLAIGSFLVVGWFAIPHLLIYPRMIPAVMLPMAVATLVVGVWAGWFGAVVGDWLGTYQRATTPSAPVSRTLFVAAGAVLVLFVTIAAVAVTLAPRPA
ncbi:MAG TPA: hypothetical protein VF510_02795 [Ktedonobacterales bacterium]